MKAVVFEQFAGPLLVRRVPDPEPHPHGVVVRVESTGICRSDWHGWQGHDSDVRLPHVPGQRPLWMIRLGLFLYDHLARRNTLAAEPNASLHVWDPVPAPLARKAGFERQQLMVQADSRGALQRFLTAWLPLVRRHESRAVKWVIDVDPLEV